MTIPPNVELKHATQEFLDSEFTKPEWQTKLASCSRRHLPPNRSFPPSSKFPDGGTTMYFELVCQDITVALLAKFISPDRTIYQPEWRPQALLLGSEWHIN